METLAELRRVEKQKMRAEREVERVVRKRQRRQFGVNVAAVCSTDVEVLQERGHCRHPDATEILDGRDGLPHELVLVPAGLLQHLVVGPRNAFADVSARKTIERIAGGYPRPETSRFSVEACGTVAAAQNLQPQIAVAQ